MTVEAAPREAPISSDQGNLYRLVQQRASDHPDLTAFGAEEGLIWRNVTGAEMLAASDHAAREMASRGVRDGDRIVLWTPNHWRTVALMFGAWKLGAIVVPFDREMNREGAERILESVGPRLVITGYDQDPPWSADTITEWWPSSTDPDPESDGWSPPAESLAAIFFTSGTTGNPKGCMISHSNLLAQVDGLREIMPLDTDCRLASILPLSHLFELVCGMLYPFSTGAAVHYIPSRRSPDILRVLNDQQITHMNAVPQLLTVMGKALDDSLRERLPGPVYRGIAGLANRLPLGMRRPLYWPVHRKIGGKLRVMAAGGAALPTDTQLTWERIGVQVVQGYGTSECSPVIACGNVDGSTPIGSVGKPIRGMETRLSDEGELQVRGTSVMRGYWKDTERTDEVLQDGWYSTGDLAYFDDAGNIVLSGRAKDLIVLPSGMNVWPEDIENGFRAHPAIKDAALIQVPTEAGGASLHVHLIAEGTPTIDLKSIVAETNGKLAVHQRVATASWFAESDFPRTSTLKVRRHLLPMPSSEDAVEIDATQASDDPIGQAIAGAVRAKSVRDDQTLGELGLDSLALVDLILAIEEKTGRVLQDDDLHLDHTVAEVRTIVTSGGSDAEEGAAQHESAGGYSISQWPYTWGRIFRFLSVILNLVYSYGVSKTVVSGKEHLKTLPPRLIIAGTHHGFPDLPLVRHGLAKAGRRDLSGRLVIAAAASGFERSVWGWLLRIGLGIYPLRQYSDRDVSLRGLARLTEKGNPVLIFPQGTHAKPAEEIADDPRVRFKSGVAHLASALNASVVPFGVAGTELRMSPDVNTEGSNIGGVSTKIDRGPLAIAFGAPLSLDEGESMQDFAARLQEVCYRLTRHAEADLENIMQDD